MEPYVIAICVIAFLVGVVITRLIFSIPTIIRELKNQTSLLRIIALKQGATEKEIDNQVSKGDSLIDLNQ